MRRVIKTLNEMSFELPKGYEVSKDKYQLMNGQGFFNRENYVSLDGKVISLFEVHRDPDEFLQGYKELSKKYTDVTDKYELCKSFSFKVGDFIFPAFVIRGYNEKLLYVVQIFVNCGNCLGCFMINIDNWSNNVRKSIEDNVLLNDLIKILRTIE